MHLIFCVSGMHGKTLNLNIKRSKKICKYSSRRKFKCNFIFLYYDIYLQHTGLNLSQFKIFLILIKEIRKNFIEYPKLMFYYLFTRYEFKVFNQENL